MADWILWEPGSSDSEDSTDNKSTDELKDKPAKDSVDKPIEESTDKTARESTDMPMEELMKPLVSQHQAECTEHPVEKSTDKPADKPADESIDESTDELSDSKIDDRIFHAAAESLKHLSEQELQDLSEDYYVDPQLKKLLELRRGNAHSRKGKEKACPRYPYAENLTFKTVDGISEFVNAPQLLLIPRVETLGQMSKEEYLEVVNTRTTKADPAEKMMKRPIWLRAASRMGISRQNLDVSQPATILKLRQVAKVREELNQSSTARAIYNRTPLSKPAGVTNLPGLFQPHRSPLPRGRSPLPAESPTIAESISSFAAAITVIDASVDLEPVEVSIIVPDVSDEPAEASVIVPNSSAKLAEAPERGLESLQSLASPRSPAIVESSKTAKLGKITEQAMSVQYLKYSGATQKLPRFPKIAESRKPVEFTKLPESLKSVEGFRRPVGFASYQKPLQSPNTQNTPAEFGAHRTDFRSTIDALELARSEFERILDHTIDSLTQGVQELRKKAKVVDAVAVQAPKSAGLLEPAEIFPSLEVMHPAKSLMPAKASKVAETPKPAGVSRNIRFQKSPEALMPPRSRFAESSRSEEHDEMFPTHDISLASKAKRRSSVYTQEPMEVKRRGQVGQPSESPRFKMLNDEEDDVWPSTEGEADAPLNVAPLSLVDHALASATLSSAAVIGSPPSPNARGKAKKRTPPPADDTSKVKRRGEVGGPSESPKFGKVYSDGEDRTTLYEEDDDARTFVNTPSFSGTTYGENVD
ncbi:hypothetical protein B0T09DRAFT_51796 [Sordaria sp. MPI-SDFR-AT-0083]|nr:hypothetical protein B0T09DRAFT_51796 [Sordaria sp. MPI-SDFR-AT-0083]